MHGNPSKPEIQYSYVSFQQETQDRPFPGTQLQNDLSNLANGISETIDALTDVRRGDGALNNEIVTYDSLDGEVKLRLDQGRPGSSAYELAVAKGFIGTEDEWLASLVGAPGEAPDFSIGNVLTLDPEDPVQVSLTGTDAAPILNFGIPKGEPGVQGPKGDKGDTGDTLLPTIAIGQKGFQVYVKSDESGYELARATIFDAARYGIVGDNATDNHQAFVDMFDDIAGLGSSYYGAAYVILPPGRIKTSPITHDIQSLRMQGAGQRGTRVTAFEAAQDHIFHFTNAAAAIDLSNFELLGWQTTGELANYPSVGILFEGGSNDIHEMQINRCRGLLHLKRGNFNKIWRNHLGFFDQHAVRLGGVDTGGGAAISETWIEEVSAYSGAANHGGGDGANAGTQFLLGSGCGATRIRMCEGGSTAVGIEIVDDLALANDRAPGHVFVSRYNSGQCVDAGLWIKNNGASFEAENSRFSADRGATGDGVRIDSPNAAPIFTDCSFQTITRDGCRITNGYSAIFNDCLFYNIGDPSGSPLSRGVHCAAGSATVYVNGCLFDKNLRAATARIMHSAVRLAGAYAGDVEVLGSVAKNMTSGDWVRDGSSTGTLTVHSYNAASI